MSEYKQPVPPVHISRGDNCDCCNYPVEDTSTARGVPLFDPHEDWLETKIACSDECEERIRGGHEKDLANFDHERGEWGP